MAAMVVDATIVIESFAVALLFRFEGDVLSPFWGTFWPFAIFAALAFVLLLYWSGVYQSTLRYSGIYQDVQQGEALVVPRWVLRVASATALAAGGLFIADFAVGEILNLRPVPLLVILAGALLAYVQLVAVRHVPRVFNTS
jgi:FlaA1/EpsC-like NDP-sugar epimerase